MPDLHVFTVVRSRPLIILKLILEDTAAEYFRHIDTLINHLKDVVSEQE